jgi:hypothetical protein
MRKILIACILLSGCGGASAVYHAPVKVVRGVTPPVVFPVTKGVVKVGAMTVKNTVMLPVRIASDSAKTSKKSESKTDHKPESKKDKKPKKG